MVRRRSVKALPLMTRGSAITFRRRDVTAAIRAVKAAGHEVDRIEIDRHGKIVVIMSRTGEADQPAEGDALDKWMASHADAT
jgi:hypothetical protein